MAEPDAQPIDAPSAGIPDAPTPTPEQAKALALMSMRARAADAGADGGADDAMPDEKSIADDPQRWASTGQIAKASLAADPNLQVKRYAAMFGQPPSDFRITQAGKIIRKTQDGTFAYVEPNKMLGKNMGQRTADEAASMAGPSIPAVAGGLGTATGAALGIESGPGTLAAATGMGMAAGASGELTRQKLDRQVANDPDQPIDWGNVAWQTAGAGMIEPVNKALGALGRMAARAPGIRTILARAGLQNQGQLQALQQRAAQAGSDEHPLSFLPPGVMEDIGGYLENQWQHIRQVSQDAVDLGVNSLSLGQKTNSPTLKRIERWLAGTPEGAEMFGRTKQIQNEGEIPAAVGHAMDDIAPPANPGTRVAPFREAADDVVTQAQNAQSRDATTAYAAALDDPTRPLHYSDDLQGLVGRINEWNPQLLRDARTSATARGYPWQGALEFDADGNVARGAAEPNWRSMDFLKRALSGVENGNMNQYGRLNNTGDIARQFRQNLTGILDDQNPLYAQARGRFGNSADVIDQILQGGVGRIQAMTGPDRQNMINRIFSGGDNDLLPHDVEQARRLFQAAGHGDEWMGAFRSYVDSSLDKALKIKENGGETGNVAGKMLQLSNTNQQRNVIAAALGNPQQANNMTRLFHVLEAASRSLPEGSPTSPNQEFSRAQGNTALRWARNAYNTVTGSGIVDRGMDALDQHLATITEPAARRRLAEYMLSPNSDVSLRRILTNMPSTRALASSPAARDRGALQIGRLLTAAGISGAGQALPDDSTQQ